MALEDSPFEMYVGKDCQYSAQNGVGITGKLTKATHYYLEFRPFVYSLPSDEITLVNESARINITDGKMYPLPMSLEELVSQVNEKTRQEKERKKEQQKHCN